jgi:hypothetical protein
MRREGTSLLPQELELTSSLNYNLNIRLIDVEYQKWPQFTFGTFPPYGVGFGLSYHIFNGSR